jgi:hypothetical protein
VDIVSTVLPDNLVSTVNVLDVAVLDGKAILPVPIVKANVSPAVRVLAAKFDTVTACPDINHVEDENPTKLDSVHVPAVKVNSDGKVTTILAEAPVAIAVCVAKDKVKSVESNTVKTDALNVGLITSTNAPAVAVIVIPVSIYSYLLSPESYSPIVKLPVVAILDGFIKLLICM